MTGAQIQMVVAIIASIVLPLLLVMARIIVKWSRVESRLDIVVEKLDQIVKDKDRDHLELANRMRDGNRELANQMTADRNAVDRRLRWLEEHVWIPKGRS